MQRFGRVDPGDDAVPDETTIPLGAELDEERDR
jgi:hypothetical protein